MKRRLQFPLAVLLALCAAVTLSANLVQLGSINVPGGIGAVNTTLTIDGHPTESGCVAWNGTSDVIGAAACPSGISGGDEKTGGSQTHTHSIAELGLTNAASIRVIVNTNEPAGGGYTLDKLVLRIYAANTGAVLFTGSLPSAVVRTTSDPGIGWAGLGFALDDAQAISAQAAFANTANRIGLSAQKSDTSGGQGTFYIANVTTPQPPAVCPTITVNPATLPTPTVGVAYSQTITGSGGTGPYTFSAVGGSVPAGLGLSTGGVLSGTPTTVDTYSLTVRATDANSCFADRTYTLSVEPASCPAISLSPSSLPDGTVGTAYRQTIVTSGGTAPYAADVVSGSLPAGLTLGSDGVLSGTPTASGTAAFTVRTADANGCFGERTFSIAVPLVVPTLPEIFVAVLALGLAAAGYLRLRRRAARTA